MSLCGEHRGAARNVTFHHYRATQTCGFEFDDATGTHHDLIVQGVDLQAMELVRFVATDIAATNGSSPQPAIKNGQPDVPGQ